MKQAPEVLQSWIFAVLGLGQILARFLGLGPLGNFLLLHSCYVFLISPMNFLSFLYIYIYYMTHQYDSFSFIRIKKSISSLKSIFLKLSNQIWDFASEKNNPMRCPWTNQNSVLQTVRGFLKLFPYLQLSNICCIFDFYFSRAF